MYMFNNAIVIYRIHDTILTLILLIKRVLEFQDLKIEYAAVHYTCKLLYGCAYVKGDNPRALASRLSPVQTNKLYNNLILQQHK